MGWRLLAGDERDRAEAATVAPVTVDPTVAGAAGDVNVSAGVPTVVGPTGRVWGVPVGYAPSEAGAQAAAVGWVASLGALMRLGPVALGDVLGELMTHRAAPEALEAARSERDRFVTEFDADPVRAIWIESPLQFELVEYTPDRAVVAVWSQLVMGVDTEPQVWVLWRTHTVTVVWERDSWRVDDVVRVEGPTPLVVDSALPSPGSEFTRLAGWEPAVASGNAVLLPTVGGG